MLFKTSIETERLLLRPETLDDCDDIHAINTDPAVMYYIGNGSIMSLSRDGLYERLTQLFAQRIEDEYGLAAVVLKETDQYIGACWLRYDAFCDGVELGYRYRQDAWGHGYATEAAKAVLKEGFQLPQLDSVFAYTHPRNAASRRVIQKLGFEHIQNKYHPQVKAEIPIYQIKR